MTPLEQRLGRTVVLRLDELVGQVVQAVYSWRGGRAILFRSGAVLLEVGAAPIPQGAFGITPLIASELGLCTQAEYDEHIVDAAIERFARIRKDGAPPSGVVRSSAASPDVTQVRRIAR